MPRGELLVDVLQHVRVHLRHELPRLRHGHAEHLGDLAFFLPLRLARLGTLLALERLFVLAHLRAEPVPRAPVHDVEQHLVPEVVQQTVGPFATHQHRLGRRAETQREPKMRLGVPQHPAHAVTHAADEESALPQRVAAPGRAPAEGLVREVCGAGQDDELAVVTHGFLGVRVVPPLVVVHDGGVAGRRRVHVDAERVARAYPYRLLEHELDERAETRVVRFFVDLRPLRGVVHGVAVPAAVPARARPHRQRAELAANPQRGDLQVAHGEPVAGVQVEENAAERVVLVVLRLRGEALVL
mmetsp:Transcript_13486/g.57536  ORF Transcript_13486/g.57536 Transcript_13486/m.57536 type:complete len:299 (+) Transcript_13486:347-1243(+)